jgi:hypothetical protein
MKTRWIETSILAYYRTTDEDGINRSLLSVFGVVFGSSDYPEDKLPVGFRLSLYELDILRTPKPGEFTRVSSYPLLKALLGEKVIEEIAHPEDVYVGTVGGLEYTIVPYTRFTAYDHVKRFWRLSDVTVYLISCPGEPDLPPYTMARPEWDGRRPTLHEAVNSARAGRDLMSTLTKDLGTIIEKDGNEPK